MKGIDILVNEHENVLQFTDSVKEKCISIFNGKELNIEYFNKIIDFGRNYVDRHHHKEEEDILFKKMKEALGMPISHIIDDGMMFDHNVGRMFLMNIEYAIQDFKMYGGDEYKFKIVSNAFNYANMMEDHISKENEVLYPYAENNLEINHQNEINNLINKFETEAENKGIQNKYMQLLQEIKQS